MEWFKEEQAPLLKRRYGCDRRLSKEDYYALYSAQCPQPYSGRDKEYSPGKDPLDFQKRMNRMNRRYRRRHDVDRRTMLGESPRCNRKPTQVTKNLFHHKPFAVADRDLVRRQQNRLRSEREFALGFTPRCTRPVQEHFFRAPLPHMKRNLLAEMLSTGMVTHRHPRIPSYQDPQYLAARARWIQNTYC
ncbi:hypothetical protein GE061_017524 [Apolygus lucorum]|uniref:Uncharacterized protein n=1 Tax=Apolygus lucorum TaxID=248454 RepID=A0A8S9XCN1_APOLU|nr:hypothetical protein GE061_017524 [Apolygus lucorum]